MGVLCPRGDHPEERVVLTLRGTMPAISGTCLVPHATVYGVLALVSAGFADK